MKIRMKKLISFKTMPILALALLVFFVPITYAQVTIVYPTGNPVLDVPNVQNAVNSGGTVILKAGTFDFGSGSISVTVPVTIQGEVDGSGNLLTTIKSTGTPNGIFNYDGITDGDYVFTKLRIDMDSIDNTRDNKGIYWFNENINQAGSFIISECDFDLEGRTKAIDLWVECPEFPLDILNCDITITNEAWTAAYGVGGIHPNIALIGCTIDITGGGWWARGLANHFGYKVSAVRVDVIGNTITMKDNLGLCVHFNGVAVGRAINNVFESVEETGPSPSYHVYVNGASNVKVLNNVVKGTSRMAIASTNGAHDVTISGNEIRDFRSTVSWGAPIIVEKSTNCTVTNNKLIDVYDADNYAAGKGPIAGIRISGYGTWDIPNTNNTVQGNDYSASGLPGFVEYDEYGNLEETGEPGCILLEAGWWGSNYGEAENNHVVELLSPTGKTFPPGTNLCTQVLDMTDNPATSAYDGKNHISGYDACLANPNWGSILEHLQEKLGEVLATQTEDLPPGDL